jgi:hypothetical protein|tara:strand:+ start:1865 stop:2050 length:186 start_codon:yes stop_codon:yes gene_type:complete
MEKRGTPQESDTMVKDKSNKKVDDVVKEVKAAPKAAAAKTMTDKHGFLWELDAEGNKVKRL